MRMALMLAAVALTAAPAAAQGSAVDSDLAALERTFTYRQGDCRTRRRSRDPARAGSLPLPRPDDAKRLHEDGGSNPPGDAPLGMLIATDVSPFSDDGWGVVITFEEDSYVDDDDASTIDFDELLVDMQRDVREEERSPRGSRLRLERADRLGCTAAL